MALQTGQLFGNYRIVRLIGEGGFGEVYLAENPLIDRRVAVKVLHPGLAQDAELVRRFLNEARAASAIRHPNITEVLDAGGTPDGAPYILMEFLEGVSLQKHLADVGRLPLPQILDIANQAGSALAAAHAVGIVHRDLKPENLFLVPDPALPSGERVKVLDFGIAKMKHGAQTGGTVRTQSGLIMGSPAYMSPEQCKDSADVDLRSDIYSFATILYEMIAGRTPHVAPTGTELLIMHLTETPRPLRELAADVPAHVEAAIMRALARARDDRFNSISAFLGALQGAPVGDTAILGPSSSLATPPARGARAASRTERIVPTQPNTTFSRSTGDLEAAAVDESSPPRQGRRIAFLAIGAVALCGAAVGVGLKYRGHPRADGQGPTPKSATPTHPLSVAPEASPVLLPIPTTPGTAATNNVHEPDEATAEDSGHPVAKSPSVGGEERRKRTVKGRTSVQAKGSETRAASPKPPQASEPSTATSLPANSGTAPMIIKHRKF
jgi:eukaryotic-like serine/threonine-protein kinase